MARVFAPISAMMLAVAALAAAPDAVGQTQTTAHDARQARAEAEAALDGIRGQDVTGDQERLRAQLAQLAEEWTRGHAFLESHAALALEFDAFTRRRDIVDSGCVQLSRDMEALEGNPFAANMPARAEQCWRTLEWANEVYAGYANYLRSMSWYVGQARAALEVNRDQDDTLRQQLDILGNDMGGLQDQAGEDLDNFLGVMN